MTLTYAGYNIAAMAEKYKVETIPRTVEGPNPIDSIAGTHEPDLLAQKVDLVVHCVPLTDAQMNTLLTLAKNAIDVPYQKLRYVLGAVDIYDDYRISVGTGTCIREKGTNRLFGGVILTFTQR